MKRVSYLIELATLALFVPVAKVLRACGWKPRSAVITGWWGSETLGDVAILGQLISECREVASEVELKIASFDTTITSRTLANLGARDVKLLAVGFGSAWAMAFSRTCIFGGGPLMESPSMRVWAWEAGMVRAAGGKMLCYANGIGPVRTSGATRTILRLLRSASRIVVRDHASRRWLEDHAPSLPANVTFDPAFDYVHRRIAAHRPHRDRRIALALRAPPASYLGHAGTGAATRHFISLVADALNDLLQSHPVRMVGIVMHDGERDSDDHAVYEQLRDGLSRPDLLTVRPGHQTLDDAIADVAGSCAAFTVRFHGMILALATGTPFVAVDYARPFGKVSGAATMVGRADDVIAWDDLDSRVLADRLRKILEGPEALVPALEPMRQLRLSALREVMQ